MAVATSGRALAAILFTDMVDSTTVAEELGDRRWKALIDQHHRTVRQELKRFGGRELDTAGDGFFASFREPAAAIACACTAADAVRGLGIQIRAGVHFGECERIGKKLGGISVVVGARIMALGGPGEVLISSTAAELTKGAGFGLADRGSHVLKGVDDQWHVFAVTAIDGELRTPPMSADEAREHRTEVTATEQVPRRRMAAVTAAAIVVLLVAGGVALAIWPDGAPVPTANTVARINANSNSFDQSVSLTSASQPQSLTYGDGLLWVSDSAKKTVSGFDPTGSAAGDLYGTPSTPTDLAFTDGRVWISYGFSSDPHRGLDVLDPAKSGLAPAPFSVAAGSYPLAVGTRVVWVANPLDSALVRYDVDTGDTTTVLLPKDSDPIDLAASSAGDLWVAAGREPLVFHLAPGTPTGRMTKFQIDSIPTSLSVSPDGSLWVVSESDDSVAALSASGAPRLASRRLGGRCDAPSTVLATEDAIWVSCSGSQTVIKLRPSDGDVAAVLPVDGTPGDLTLDDAGEVWVLVSGSTT